MSQLSHHLADRVLRQCLVAKPIAVPNVSACKHSEEEIRGLLGWKPFSDDFLFRFTHELVLRNKLPYFVGGVSLNAHALVFLGSRRP